ncbi:MAG: 4Fe-4S binding protein [candidate division WOR-3 bacterium]|nr:4Fe-4S binding protein [candidate division WOR-3 bacterium]
MDPLILLIVSISNHLLLNSYLYSLVLIFSTLLFGRFFCGFICPLGTVIDLTELAGKLPSLKFRPELKNFKYLILLFLIISAILGVSFIYYFDPIVIFERSLLLIVFPVITFFFGFFTAEPSFAYVESLFAIIFLAIIIGLNFLTRRFWCQNICPLGGLFAFLSKFSLFRFVFDNKCKKCALCEKVCPTDAIDSKSERVDSSECILCLRCNYECPENIIRYKSKFLRPKFDIKRRELLLTTGSAMILAPLLRSTYHQRLEGRLIRPPGSIPEAEFLNRCLHCGRCMKICPTNGLQPCIFESGITGMWTPRLIPRIGACEKNCNMCGKVCPTSAIRNLSLEEKSYVKIGTAIIDRVRCIAWEQNKTCLICDEACQYNAINMVNETIQGVTLGRPYVDERICTGCGMCEYRCPVEGESAIRVYAIGEERRASGSYITEEKKKLRSCEEKEEDIPSGFIIE